MRSRMGCEHHRRELLTVISTMTKRTLRRLGYSIKNTSAVGWWVDGLCGYMVSGYYATAAQAVAAAGQRIKDARATGARPIWLFV